MKIIGKSIATAEQMESFVRKINPKAPELAQTFLEEGEIEGVTGDIAFAQAIHETNYFRFGGQVLPEQNNFAGIGATNGSPVGKGAWFPDPRTGVRAQIQHLKAYASKEPLKQSCVDPRFRLVTRGIAPEWENLNGRWAVPGPTYGQSIMKIWEGIMGTKLELYKKIRHSGSNVHIVEMNPGTYRLDITEGIPGKLEPLSKMFGEPKLNEVTWVRMNAQFFGGSTRGYGSFVDPADNLTDKQSSPGYADIIYANNRFYVQEDIKTPAFKIGTSYGLIKDGKTDYIYQNWHKALMDARHPRSMAGQLKNGNFVFIVVDGRWLNLSLGMTAQQQATMGRELGCTQLVSFDGGGSSQIMIGDKIENRPSDGRERAVVSAIVAYRRYALDELPVLKKGANGVYVNLLQRLLIAKGYQPGPADGAFGTGTTTAVRAFQYKNRLTVDNVVGSKTWGKLTEGVI